MSETKTCPSCQRPNPPDAKVCIHCGSVLTGLHSSNTTIPVSEAASRISHPEHIVQLVRLNANIIVFQVLGTEQPILVKDATKIIIGRFNPGETTPTIDLTPYNANLMGVSRQHAVITRNEKGYALEDLASTNGTWLNEVKLTQHQPYDLRNGDLLRFGQLAMYTYFRTNDAEVPVVEETIRLKNRQVEASFKLTPLNLETTIAPYLNALANVQSVCSQLLQEPEADVVITAVNTDAEKALIEVRLVGAKQAVRLIKEKIIPWRETYMSKIAYLAAKSNPVQQTESTGTTGQFQHELHEAEMVLASQILADMAPDRPENERKSLLDKLLPQIHILNFSTLQITNG